MKAFDIKTGGDNVVDLRKRRVVEETKKAKQQHRQQRRTESSISSERERQRRNAEVIGERDIDEVGVNEVELAPTERPGLEELRERAIEQGSEGFFFKNRHGVLSEVESEEHAAKLFIDPTFEYLGREDGSMEPPDYEMKKGKLLIKTEHGS